MGISLEEAMKNPKLAAVLKQQPKRKPVAKAIRKVSRKNLKATAWDWFSRYIRLRDSLATTGNTTACKCITCGAIHQTFNGLLQAGHWLGGRAGKNLFDERGCNAQCVKCNRYLHGNNQSYTLVMMNKYPKEVIEELIRQGHEPYQYSLTELEEIRDKYKALAKELGYVEKKD